jgi:hypothetical protein
MGLFIFEFCIRGPKKAGRIYRKKTRLNCTQMHFSINGQLIYNLYSSKRKINKKWIVHDEIFRSRLWQTVKIKQNKTELTSKAARKQRTV